MLMSAIPAFEIGVWNAWIFTIWLLIQNYVFKLLVSKEIYQKAGDPDDVEPSSSRKIAGYISITLWLTTTAYSVFLPFQLGTVWFYTGLVIFLLGIIINISATTAFITTPAKNPITKGAYRYSRHPMYISILLIYLSVTIASASWIFLLASVIWLVLLWLTMGDEENYCSRKYGDTYREYMNRTPRWIGIPRS